MHVRTSSSGASASAYRELRHVDPTRSEGQRSVTRLGQLSCLAVVRGSPTGLNKAESHETSRGVR
eukprot:scaffold52813_cov41-Tisochrysis_lutea.AAC.4